jgi:hypothetical protein
MLAIVPPDSSTPLQVSGKPISAASHAMTFFSTKAGAWLKPARCGFIPEASMSASIASGVPLPCTQPKKRGWRLPLG